MPQLFSWKVSEENPTDPFKTSNYKEMRVTCNRSSNFRVNVNIDGAYYEFVEPGKEETYRLPNKEDYTVFFEKPNGAKGVASGGCTLS